MGYELIHRPKLDSEAPHSAFKLRRVHRSDHQIWSPQSANGIQSRGPNRLKLIHAKYIT